MACVVRADKAEIKIDKKNQTHDKIHELLDQLLRENGAVECGIMGALTITFEKPAGAH